MRKPEFCTCQNKAAEIGAFIFAIQIVQIVQSFFYLYANFKLLVVSVTVSVCATRGRKPQRPFFL